MLFIPWEGGREGGRLQGAGAPRCHTLPLDRQLEISRLLPATNGEGFPLPPPPSVCCTSEGKERKLF